MLKNNLKKYIYRALFIIFILFIVIKITNIINSIHNNDEKLTIYNVDKDKLPFSQQEIYNQFFDINNIISFSIDITNSEIKKMEDDYEKNGKSEIYRMANLTITIEIPNDKSYAYYFEEVGIRLKGSTSQKSLYNEENGILNLNNFKINFHETFDDLSDGYKKGEYYLDTNGNSTWNKRDRRARKNRVFGNMKKVDIKWNRSFDTTYIREYYAYKLFRSEKIAAPHTGLTTVNLNIIDKNENSEYLGVYITREVVDTKFIENNLLNNENTYILNSNGDYEGGDLYKAKWDNASGKWIGGNLTKECSYGVANDLRGITYNYELKTNKKNPSYNSIKNLLEGLSNISSKEDIKKYVDMDYFIKFAAVSYVLGNADDMRNNYNNYYLYFYKDNTNEKSSTQKVIMIPYDYDRCLGITIDMNQDQTAMTDIDPYSTQAIVHGKQENPLYIHTVCDGGYYIDEYNEALNSVLNNKLFSMESFIKDYNIAQKNYGDKVTPSKDFNNIISTKNNETVTKESFYFTLDTTNDIRKINTTDIDNESKNLIISDYFSRISSKLKDTVK